MSNDSDSKKPEELQRAKSAPYQTRTRRLVGPNDRSDEHRLYRLRHALRQRQFDNIERLTPDDYDLMDAGSADYNETALHCACAGGEERYIVDYIQHGAPVLARTTQNDDPFYQLTRHTNHGGIADMVSEFERLVILPVTLLEAEKLPPHLRQPILEDHYDDIHKTSDRYFYLRHMHGYADQLVRQVLFPEPTHPAGDYRNMPRAELMKQPFMREFMRPLNLSRTWHNPGIAVPHQLRPYLTTHHWQPLLVEDFVTKDGYRVTCLTDSKALRKEGETLKHCVGKSTYDIACCSKDQWRSHILSVRDPKGNPVSTAQVWYHNDARTYEGDIEVGGTSYRLNVAQHHGAYNGTPTREAAKALNEFLSSMKDEKNAKKYLTAEPEKLGEIEAKRETNAPSRVEEYLGFTPSWDAAEKMFNEYRRAERRASTAYLNGKLVYDDAIDPEDPQQFKHSMHFIDGYVLIGKDGKPHSGVAGTREALHPTKDETCVALRDLGLRDWLNATGIMEAIHRQLHGEAEQLQHRQATSFEWEGKNWRTKIVRAFTPNQVAARKQALDEDAKAVTAYEAQDPTAPVSGEKVPLPGKPRDERKDWAGTERERDKRKFAYFAGPDL